ncbi:hypothetical protein DFH09DRAFT_1165833 [Mycena vulgaris]|nr:hypothetical protein DFH09DRAFT_1165833 [Mycena vulgaris]
MDPTILLLGQPSASRIFESQAKTLIEASDSANIARIESQIRDLVRLRDRERGVIARLRMAIAPIHKLPAELLVEIFRLATDHASFTRKHAINKIHALSQVCAYWRRLAHTTPQLWTVSHGMTMTLRATPTDSCIAGAKSWLERSAPLPVPVYLCISGQGSDPRTLMDVLISAAHRWEQATFELDSLAVLSRIPPNALKALQSLTLDSQDKQSHPTVVTFLTAPRLRHLTLASRQTVLLSMPWSQLTDISVTNPSPRLCVDALLQCTNIVSAKFDTRAWPALPDLSEIGITTLSRLETLNFTVSTSGGLEEHFMSFFACLALPTLKELNLDLNIDLIWPSLEFTQFQARTPNIERMSIENSRMRSSDLLAVLRHAPSLTELRMDCCMKSFDDTLLAGLQYSEGNILHLAPRLKTISFSVFASNFEEDALDAMIQSRWWTDEQLSALPAPPKVARWSSIAVCCEDDDDDGDISPEFQARIAEYRSQGLDVTVY